MEGTKNRRLRKARNCEGCRAFDELSKSYQPSCTLGYDNKGPMIAAMGIHRFVPQERCPKPMTFDQLFDSPKKSEVR